MGGRAERKHAAHLDQGVGAAADHDVVALVQEGDGVNVVLVPLYPHDHLQNRAVYMGMFSPVHVLYVCFSTNTKIHNQRTRI